MRRIVSVPRSRFRLRSRLRVVGVSVAEIRDDDACRARIWSSVAVNDRACCHDERVELAISPCVISGNFPPRLSADVIRHASRPVYLRRDKPRRRIVGVHHASTTTATRDRIHDDVYRGICHTVRIVLEDFSQYRRSRTSCACVCRCVCVCARVRAYQRVRGTGSRVASFDLI